MQRQFILLSYDTTHIGPILSVYSVFTEVIRINQKLFNMSFAKSASLMTSLEVN